MLHCAALHLFASRSWFAPPLRLALPCGTLRRRVKGLAQIRYGKRASEGLGVDRFFRRERKRTRLVGKKRERVVVEFSPRTPVAFTHTKNAGLSVVMVIWQGGVSPHRWTATDSPGSSGLAHGSSAAISSTSPLPRLTRLTVPILCISPLNM